jgi:hypothetical protein
MRSPILSCGSHTSCNLPVRTLSLLVLFCGLSLSFLSLGLLADRASAAGLECETCRPWFRLSSGSRPANLSAGQRRDEVQKLSVNATGGSYALRVPTGTGNGTITDGS